MATETIESKGHVAFSPDGATEIISDPEGWEFYYAPTSNPIGADGYRLGARFLCFQSSIELFLENRGITRTRGEG